MTQVGAFPCDRCGACCRQVHRSPETIFMDRGDGICRHYNENQHLCNIYESRPDICRVEQQYFASYQAIMDWPEFVRINLAACDVLKNLG